MRLSVLIDHLRREGKIPPLGTPHVFAHWMSENAEEIGKAPMIEMVRYNKLLAALPDKIVTNLEKARLAQDGRIPMLRAGGGTYEELLTSIIIDATAISSSSSEAKLAPTLAIPLNYLSPGGLSGRTLRMTLRGRVTTLTTQATMTLRNRIATTDIITGTILQASGAITMDTVAQTNTLWNWKGELVTRSVGAGGTVFAMGDADLAPAALTIANQQARQTSSGGSSVPSTAVYDTTQTQFFQITGQWSLATAYAIQTHLYIFESLN